jgi:hypothetical protein
LEEGTEPAPTLPGGRFRTGKARWASGLFLACLLVSLAAVNGHVSVDERFVADEWYLLATNMRTYGVLGFGDQPSALRAPAYPALVALVLVPIRKRSESLAAVPWLIAAHPIRLAGAYGATTPRAVYEVQAVLLAAAAALFFLWLAELLPLPYALAGGALLGMNPYCLVLTGTQSYAVLHLLGLCAGGFLLERAWAAGGAVAFGLTGAFWGLVALVTPATLLLPLFVGCALLLRRGGSGLRPAVAFAVGMCGVLAPWTARNYVATGRFVPVTADFWASVSASTYAPFTPDPFHPIATRISASPETLAIVREVTHASSFSLVAYRRNLMAFEDAFRHAALGNIRARPEIFLGNVLANARSFACDIDSVLIDVFEFSQENPLLSVPPWLYQAGSGGPHGVHGREFALFFGLLSSLAAGGLATALLLRSQAGTLTLATLLCLVLARATSGVDIRDYYQKVPFVLLYAFCLLGEWGRGGARAPRLLALGLLFGGLVLTAITLR